MPTGRLAGTFLTTMFEQPINTRFPGQQFPVGSVVMFLDRHRRTVFGTVTELRRVTKPSSAAARPADGRVRCAWRINAYREDC